ncbi:outer membrane insertion C-terminal signal [Fibrobacter sp. UWH5]|nr:outer membrane insertion C-terminal signal [Fibrobacter sp. UWH5]
MGVFMRFIKSLIFLLVVLCSAGNAHAGSAASDLTKGAAKILLFIPGMMLEEYFASLFDGEGRVDYSEESVFIPYIKVSGIHPDYKNYIVQTFGQYVKEVGRYKLVAADKESPYVKSASMAIVSNLAKRKGCPYILYITVKEQGSGMLLTFAMKDTENDNLVWHDEYQAIIPEDIAPILFRVANSMGTGKKGSNPKSFYDSEYPIYISESNFQPVAATHESGESNLPSNFENKLNTSRTTRVAFSFGVDYLIKSQHAAGNIGFSAWHDFTYFMVGAEIDFKGIISKDTNMIHLGLNLAAPIFIHENNTPYVIAGAGLSGTKYTTTNYRNEEQDKNDQGATFSLGAGYQFNRYGTWTVRFGLKYFRNNYYTNGHKLQGIGLETIIGY